MPSRAEAMRGERAGARGERAGGLALLLALAACATPDRVAGPPGPPPPPAAPPERPVSDSPVKIGAPYQVANRWYYPADDRAYDAVGFASWYGPGFHGAATANGERFDQHRFGAAHKTLPLPSYVEVTALDSGRTILVRINDRGPFVDDRIIDLSSAAADALGVRRHGVARVRVRRVEPPEADRIALRAGRAASPRQDADAQALALAAARFDSPERARAPLQVGDYVQVAAFADRARAEALARALDAGIHYGDSLWRVRLGPFFDGPSAEAALARLKGEGYQDARLVAPPLAR